MSRDALSGIGARIGGVAARNPRLVATLAALLLLLAVQDGAVATDGLYVEPTAEGSVDPGPDPSRYD